MRVQFNRKIYNKKIKSILQVFLLSVILVMPITHVPVQAGDYDESLYLEYDDQVYKYRTRLVTLEIDGEELETGDMPAIIINDSTMVPVREVFEDESIGAEVLWDADSEEIHITYEDVYIVLQIGSTSARINNKSVTLTAAPKLVRDLSKTNTKTMIPLRFVSENLGFDVNWDADTFTAKIDTGKNVSKVSVVDPVDVADEDDSTTTVSESANQTPSIASDEQLDKLEGTGANRSLPTELATNPVHFNISGEGEDGPLFEAEDHDLAYIQDVEFEEDTNEFIINVDGQVSDMTSHIWDGKVIIEVENADFDRSSMEIDYVKNQIVDMIRFGRHELEDGTPVGRIVFDLIYSGYQFELDLNEERNQIIVRAKNSSVLGVTLSQDDEGDYLEITGVNARSVKAFRLSNPSRLVFDIPNSVSPLGFQTSEALGQYVTSIRTAQFDDATTRIVVEVDGQPDFEILEDSEYNTKIQILEPTYENITYDNTESTPTITIEKEDDTELSGVQYTENYMDKEYIITIPGDYTSYFGSGDVKINDTIIDSINVELNEYGNTEVVIKSTTLYEFRVEETNDGITIKAYKPQELYSKIVVVDAGHGGNDPGAVVKQYTEEVINLNVVLQLKKLFDKQSDIKVYYTRTTDTRPSLDERCVLANEVEADFFISLHCNSFTDTYRGTETLYLPGKDTDGLNSFELAEIIQDTFTENTAFDNYMLKERDNLYVLKYTDMPAVILEMGYLTNEHDRSYLTDENYYDNMAEAVYKGIVQVFEEYPTGR